MLRSTTRSPPLRHSRLLALLVSTAYKGLTLVVRGASAVHEKSTFPEADHGLRIFVLTRVLLDDRLPSLFRACCIDSTRSTEENIAEQSRRIEHMVFESASGRPVGRR